MFIQQTEKICVMARFKVAIPILAVALLTGTARGTVLTFESLELSGFDDIPQAYGDNVSASCDGVGCYGMGNRFTPNIAVKYRTLSVGGGSGETLHLNLAFWPTGYGDLVNITYPVEPKSTGEISLVPEPGWAVRLNSIDLAGWPEADYDNQPLLILDEDYNVLVDYSPYSILGVGPSHSTLTPSLIHRGILRIQFGNNWSVGIDNINFNQVPLSAVPTLSPWNLLILWMVMLCIGGVILSRRQHPRMAAA